MTEKALRSVAPTSKPKKAMTVPEEELLALKGIILALVKVLADKHEEGGGKTKDFLTQLGTAASEAIHGGSVAAVEAGKGGAANAVPKLLKMVSKVRAV